VLIYVGIRENDKKIEASKTILWLSVFILKTGKMVAGRMILKSELCV
jgi:hypothetical protein